MPRNEWVRDDPKLKGGEAYLSISPNGPTTVIEQLRHVIVAGELPQTSLQIKVSVEPQCTGSPERSAILVWGRLADHLWVFGGVGEEAVVSLDLSVIQQIGAAMVANAGAIWAQRQLEVRQRPRRHYRQHTWGQTQRSINQIGNYKSHRCLHTRLTTRCSYRQCEAWWQLLWWGWDSLCSPLQYTAAWQRRARPPLCLWHEAGKLLQPRQNPTNIKHFGSHYRKFFYVLLSCQSRLKLLGRRELWEIMPNSFHE